MKKILVVTLIALLPIQSSDPVNANEVTWGEILQSDLCRLRYIQRVQANQIWELSRIHTGLNKGEDPAYVADKAMRDAQKKMERIDETCG